VSRIEATAINFIAYRPVLSVLPGDTAFRQLSYPPSTQ
jgi:hypothetical protein